MGGFSTIPAGPAMVGRQVADYISQSQDSSSSGGVSEAATSARGAAEVSDQVIQDIIKHSIPMGGDMSKMVQNRPQVMLPQPIRPKQIPMGEPTGNVNATTAGGQKRNDINNLISSVGNIVKGAVNKKREKEDQALMADLAMIETISSQPPIGTNPDGSPKYDPHNEAILNTIKGDSARVKRLEKALGHNPFSGEPPPPEAQTMAKYSAQSAQKKQQKTQAITQAIAQHLGSQAAPQGGQPQQGGAMDRLMAGMPNTQQLSPVVQLQAELIKAGILPKADTSLNAMKDMIKDVMTNDAKYAEMKSKVEMSKNVALGRWWTAVEAGRTRYATEVLKQTNENTRASMRSEDYKARTAMQKEHLEKTYGAQKAANLIATLQSFDKDIASKQKEIDQVQARGDKKGADKLFQELHAIQAQKDSLETVLKLKDPGVKASGVDLLNLPPSTNDMDNEDDPDNLFK